MGLRILYILLASFLVLQTTAQSKLEFSYLTRADQHGHYTTRHSTNDLTLKGISKGLNVQYLKPVIKNIYVSLGLGYCRLGVQKIKSVRPLGTSDSRMIYYEHPSGIKPVFYTDRYIYHNLQINAGLQYHTDEKDGRAFSFGSNVLYYQSFSQKYHITWDEGINYRTHNWRKLGYGIDANFGMFQRLKNMPFYIHPKIVLPVYQQLSGDQAFGEPPSMKIGKFFSGIGYSISFGKDL